MLLESLIFMDIKEDTAEGVLSALVDQLVKQGKVEPAYKEKILEREAEYPTGIYTGEVNVAIPHADHTLVHEAAIAIAILKKPVLFHRMEDTDKTLPVQVVFMLAIDKPHGHLEILAKVSELMMDQTVLRQLVACEDKAEVYAILKDKL